jgi:DNA-binding NtrC family response regulator
MSILKNLKKKHKISVNCISHGCIQTLESYDWPGNVRELENILERVVLIHDKPTIKRDDIKYILDEHTSNINIAAPPQSRPTPSSEPSTDSVETSKAGAGSPSTVSIDTTAVKTLKELECEAIVVGLERTNWNMTTTARQLGISRMTLYRKLDQHGLRKKD